MFLSGLVSIRPLFHFFCFTSTFHLCDFVLSLARQWTREDEEEVEREKRRKEKTSCSTADPDADFSQTPRDTPTSDSVFGTDSTSEVSQGLSRLLSQFNKQNLLTCACQSLIYRLNMIRLLVCVLCFSSFCSLF